MADGLIPSGLRIGFQEQVTVTELAQARRQTSDLQGATERAGKKSFHDWSACTRVHFLWHKPSTGVGKGDEVSSGAKGVATYNLWYRSRRSRAKQSHSVACVHAHICMCACLCEYTEEDGGARGQRLASGLTCKMWCRVFRGRSGDSRAARRPNASRNKRSRKAGSTELVNSSTFLLTSPSLSNASTASSLSCLNPQGACQHIALDWQKDVCRMLCRTLRFESTTKVLAKCKRKSYRISECAVSRAFWLQ